MADLTYMIGNVVDAVISVINTVVSVLAENAEALALIMVMGLVVGAAVKFGRSAFRGLRGLIPL